MEPSFPLLPPAKKGAQMIPLRLREFADDCEERSRILREAAQRARLASIDPTLSSDDRAACLDELRHFVGSMLAYPESATNALNDNNALESSPADRISVAGADALGTKRLAQLFGMDDRNVRRAIERAVHRGLPGFYKAGSEWRADREAFERKVSELCPRAKRGVGCAHDAAHPLQATRCP